VSVSPHENPSADVRAIPGFHGRDDLVIWNISSFIEFCSNIGIIYEDDMMKVFAFNLK
jgi:hypothetical protein